jgi:hypothetical protein
MWKRNRMRSMQQTTLMFASADVFVALSHARRRVVHFRVTEHPTQE